MTDDIVTRLRDYLAIVDHAFVWNELSDAADEIERLREEVKRWRNWTEEYFYTDPDCECPLCDQVKAAVNGDR